MEHSKVQLLIKDIVMKGEVNRKDDKQVVEPNDPDDLWFYRIKGIAPLPHIHVSKPTFPPFKIMTPHTTITPL